MASSGFITIPAGLPLGRGSVGRERSARLAAFRPTWIARVPRTSKACPCRASLLPPHGQIKFVRATHVSVSGFVGAVRESPVPGTALAALSSLPCPPSPARWCGRLARPFCAFAPLREKYGGAALPGVARIDFPPRSCKDSCQPGRAPTGAITYLCEEQWK